MRITTENVREVIQQVASASPMPSFRTQNRPIVNLLGQFASFYNSAHQPQWLLAVENYGKPPMQPFDKDDYLTLVLMSLVLGFETYAKAALWITGLLAGFADYPKRINRLPRGVSTVEYLFNVLPDEIHPDFPIKKADPEAAAFFASFLGSVILRPKRHMLVGRVGNPTDTHEILHGTNGGETCS